MNRQNIRMVLLFVVVLFLVSCGGSKATSTGRTYAEENTITIGYLPITHALAILETKDYLEESNADVTIKLQKFNTWPDLMDALNSGKIDGASVLIELAMAAREKGIALKTIALSHNDGNVFVVAKNINSPKELKGKTIAIPSTQSTHYILLKELLEKNGLSLEDIKLVQLAPTEMPFSLASKAIDGYCVAEPFGAQIVSKDLGKILLKDSEIWETSACCGFVLREDVIASKQVAVDAVIQAYSRSGIRLDYDRTYHIAEKYLGQEQRVLAKSLQLISFDHLELTKDMYEELSKKMKDYEISETLPEYEAFVYKREGE